jgi:dTDP-4-dehydrorhamnose reductase
MQRVLILGSKGTLGGQLCKLYPQAIGWDREDVDVTDFASLRSKLEALGFLPEAIINCVAFNDVDGAEDRPELAYALNADFVGALAGLTKGLAIPLVHFSTNYVFDGKQGEYTETDAPAPLSIYAKSKWRGEQLIARNGGEWYVLRTAVIFGPQGESDLSKKSFVDLMLDLSAKRDTLQVVSDEINSVTYAADLAAQTLHVLAARPGSGIYHAANSGQASWFDFAAEIFRLTGKRIRLVPVSSTHFARKAVRPARAVLLNTKLPVMRDWKSALAEFLHTADRVSAI